MITNIQKWGNSLGLRLPAKLSQRLNLTPGSLVEVLLEDDHLIIKPKSKYDLKEMLNNITPQNCHSELFDDDINKGSEEW